MQKHIRFFKVIWLVTLSNYKSKSVALLAPNYNWGVWQMYQQPLPLKIEHAIQFIRRTSSSYMRKMLDRVFHENKQAESCHRVNLISVNNIESPLGSVRQWAQQTLPHILFFFNHQKFVDVKVAEDPVPKKKQRAAPQVVIECGSLTRLLMVTLSNEYLEAMIQ